MDATEKARLRVLCEVATERPWKTDGVVIVTNFDDEPTALARAEMEPRPGVDADDVYYQDRDNAALIVGAVNALPAALDALDAAERERSAAREDLARIGRLVGCDSLVGVEIHAAVEHEMLELEAARDAAERAERERDDARAEVARLTRLRAHDVESVRQLRADCERLGGELDAARAERDDARAEVETLRAEAALLREIIEAQRAEVRRLTAAVDAARREGAEAMRLAAGAVCHDVYLEDPSAAVAACINEIRALAIDALPGAA